MAVEKSPEPASQQPGDDLGQSHINMTNEDGEKGSAVEGYDVYVDPVLEKKVLRRLDKRFAPLFCALYFMAYLDRSNIGNAAVAGLRTDLGLTGPQFSVAVSVFFATYVVFMVPFVLAQRWLKTHRAIAAMACAWSVVTICTAFVSNVSTSLASRIPLTPVSDSYCCSMAGFSRAVWCWASASLASSLA
jgi:MFS transporter, ACS family, DAL5 transporter family protein